MTRHLTQRYKVVLLRGAARRGAWPFLRQAYLIALDTLLREKHLVFRASREDILNIRIPEDSALSFREISSWDELQSEDRKRLFDPGQGIDIGGADWFDRGWRLWVGEMSGCLAVLGWWRTADQSRDFFCPIPEDGELLWHVTTLPSFRGKGLHLRLWSALMYERIAVGTNSFYTNCREYNTPSHRNILRMGFRRIGHCTVSRLTGRRRWHPVRSAADPA